MSSDTKKQDKPTKGQPDKKTGKELDIDKLDKVSGGTPGQKPVPPTY